LDIDALFADGTEDSAQIKEEQASPVVSGKGKGPATSELHGSPTVKRSMLNGSSKRLVGRQDPVHDFKKIVSESSGNEIMEKAVSINVYASIYRILTTLVAVRWRTWAKS
jgi:hypothetical protein